ncbi:MAG: HAMP domain-containing sensor histidine kinase [Pedobacter sp.]|nr:HAMP domain-containing sensor histidine kinase [Pedobacter sp.]MDQ8053185.1 HAMP domain-containing sensor histidine kinase [Pedobacter sp.]
MSIGGKIRFLLLLFGICCIVTALSLNNSITQKDLLVHEADELQHNLNTKEKVVQHYLTSPERINELKRLDSDEKLALKFIADYRDRGINVLVYRDEQLLFWSSSKAFPSSLSRLKEGISFNQLYSGYYEINKKTVGNYTIVFLILVKNQFNIENQYLKNGIAPELFPRNSLSLASFTDKEIVNVFDLHKQYLFAVKLSDENVKNVYVTIKLWLWIVGLVSICLFVNSYCSWLAKKGYTLGATILITLFFVTVRLSDLMYFWFNHQFDLPIFSPLIYAQNNFLPSLGDLLLNVIAGTWVVIFAYIHRRNYTVPNWIAQKKAIGIAIHVVMLLVLTGMAFVVEEIFNGLILNSKINFDITNIINLDWISWACILILCTIWLNIYLVTIIFIEISKLLNVRHKDRLSLFLIVLGCYACYQFYIDFTIYFLVYALLIYIIAYNNYIQLQKFSIGIFAILFLSMAFLTALKYLRFNDIKERNNRESITQKLLEDADDPKVLNAINSFENGISTDSLIVAYFKKPDMMQTFSFHNYIEKNYLDGYLSLFDSNMYEYNSADSTLKHEESVDFSKYKGLVRSGAFKLEEVSFSYKINDTFGYKIYFAIIPIFNRENLLGRLVIELKSQPYDFNSRFPEFLIDGKLKSDEDFSKYSLAFYKDNKLFSQSGQYTYDMVNSPTKGFKGVTDKVVFQNEESDDKRYNHAIYKPHDQSKLIVITKEKIPFVVRLATLSFFFLVFIIFGILVYIVVWFYRNIEDNKAAWFKINRYLMINANKILYKTRIQVSIVLSVVATLIIVGWTTFYYIKSEYLEQQENAIREKVRKIQLSYENQILKTGSIKDDDETRFAFDQFANVNASILNLFDIHGTLVFTSLQKMYDYGVVGKKMGPKAYIHLHSMQRSEYVNTSEKIGEFKYAAAYAPIRNAQNQTIAYIGLPYYANEADYQAKIGLFINTLINIYALVFVLIVVLAVFLANQITNPLTFIQESIRQTKLGQRNQPIVWHRQDEIGSLIKEYNKMIAALELSAVKLARSERESAWREMAKQVAHEIKNPLTPLKLGVQLLEKSWKEQDPNFEKKFASFNKSFVEQIDSLATIASEFSNFAKMPDTKLEQLELLPFIEKALAVFNTSDRVEIVILNRTNRNVVVLGDKDQLIRIFNNLLKNAIEASEERPKCAIKIRIINDDKNAYVEIEDNGKGIDEALQDKIFVPNFTTKSSGTGLGLAFVKQAIENVGGSIEFTSEVDKGTTFYLMMPLA